MATLSSRLSPLTVSVPAASDWVSFTPVWSNWTTNVTHTGQWRRVGDSIEMLMHSTFSGANTQGGPLSLTLPNSLTIDSAKFPTTSSSEKVYVVGNWEGLDAGSSNSFCGTVFYRQDLNIFSLIYATGDLTATGVNTTSNRPFTISNGDTFTIRVTLPISGWTSHVATTTGPNALVVGGQSVGSTLSFGATSNQGFNILANNAAAIASTAAGALTLGLPSKIGSSDYAGQAIVGRTDGLAPAAGYVGQTVEGTQTALTSFPATGTYGDGTSVTLTSGRWMLSMVLDADQNGATGTLVTAGIGTASGTGSAGLTPGDTQLSITFPTASTNTGISVPAALKNITASTTYYLKVRADYTVGTPRYRCRLTAVRIA
jgi:hypothetical protein